MNFCKILRFFQTKSIINSTISLSNIALMMEAVSTPETPVNLHTHTALQPTRQSSYF
jgi:hypothetical protein